MTKGKLIIIEGTDCSGKETQSTLLVERLNKENIKAVRLSFPMYDTPTGKIIGACLLGKPAMCEELLKQDHSFFEEGGGNIDYLAACNYYAADRRYNLPKINSYLNDGYVVIIDRYVSSNMAHRGGLVESKEERLKVYKKIETLEYDVNELPQPDKTFLLYLPYEYACILKKKRQEAPDEVESNLEYLQRGEKAYLELSSIYDFEIIDCIENNDIKTIQNINDDLYNKVKELIKD